MEIHLTILNPESFEQKTDGDQDKEPCATWYSRYKSYKSDVLDEDMIKSPIGKNIERAIINDMQITSAYQIDDLIKFLENLKPVLR